MCIRTKDNRPSSQRVVGCGELLTPTIKHDVVPMDPSQGVITVAFAACRKQKEPGIFIFVPFLTTNRCFFFCLIRWGQPTAQNMEMLTIGEKATMDIIKMPTSRIDCLVMRHRVACPNHSHLLEYKNKDEQRNLLENFVRKQTATSPFCALWRMLIVNLIRKV